MTIAGTAFALSGTAPAFFGYQGESQDADPLPNNESIEERRILFEGGIYEGMLLSNVPHGNGKLSLVDGCKYTGAFRNGKAHGEGRFTWLNGDMYEGAFLNEKLYGKGRYTWANGDTYLGEFHKGDRCGTGTFTSCGLFFTGEFWKNLPVRDASGISDSLFLGLLTQTTKATGLPTYGLGIMADYLLKQGYIAHGRALEQARNIRFAGVASEDAGLIESEKIHSTLQHPGNSVLLLLRDSTHAVGLQMVHRVEGYVDFEVYNSGAGLREYHRRHHRKKDVFQTVWKRRIPLEVLTPNQLQPFLEKSANIYAVYDAIADLPGAEIIPDVTIVWQQRQKQNNCSLMWIFAYLWNNMSAQEYLAMRQQLFQDCIRAVESSIDPDQKMLAVLREKVMRLQNKRNAYFGTLNAIPNPVSFTPH